MTDTKVLPSFKSIASDILNSGLFSDITLVCSCMSEFKAHSFVLYCHSAYFRGALKNGWKEATQGRFYLQDDAETIGAMLKFMYTSEYRDHTVDQDDSSLLYLDINMCIAADYYGVTDLGPIAETSFHCALQDWDNVKEALPDAVRTIYTKNCQAVDVLKEKIVKVATVHLPELELSDKFQQLCRELGPFTSDVLLLSNQLNVHHKKLLKTRCQACRRRVAIEAASELSYQCVRCGVENDLGGLLDNERLN